VNETDRYAHEFRNSTGNVFPTQMRVNDGQSVAAEEKYTVWTIFMLMGTVQKHILRLYFSCSQLIAMPISGSVSSVHRFESNCRFLHFIDNSYLEARSCNHCSGKKISITHSKCVLVALVFQLAEHRCFIMLSPMACLALPQFSTLSHNGMIF
jgi:hypothetical protein